MHGMPAIAVHRIWTVYTPKADDPSAMKATDWVAYGPMGAADRSVVIASIATLSGVQEDAGGENPAIQMAQHRWDCIKPFYEAFKQGKTVQLDGTPLAAWNAVSPEQAEVLRMRGVQTVEQLAELTDAHIHRFGLPDLGGLVRMAALYLKSADTTRTTVEMGKLADENAALRDQLAELTQLVKDKLSADTDEGQGSRKKA